MLKVKTFPMDSPFYNLEEEFNRYLRKNKLTSLNQVKLIPTFGPSITSNLTISGVVLLHEELHTVKDESFMLRLKTFYMDNPSHNLEKDFNDYLKEHNLTLLSQVKCIPLIKVNITGDIAVSGIGLLYEEPHIKR